MSRNPFDQLLRDELIFALRAVPVPSGIGSRINYGMFADAVLGIGGIDVVLADGRHLYHSTHCRHGRLDSCVDDTDGRHPARCKTCAAPCRHTYEDSEGTTPG